MVIQQMNVDISVSVGAWNDALKPAELHRNVVGMEPSAETLYQKLCV